jgi:Flp pilus assembly protein TadG
MRAAQERPAGQALVEFALVFPIIILLIFGTIDVGRAVFAANTLSNAARQAARVAAVNQMDPPGPWECEASRPIEDPTDPHWTFRGCAIAAGSSIGVTDADVTFTVTTPPGTTLQCSPVVVNVGCLFGVTVTNQFAPITPLAGVVIGNLTLTSTSEVPVERVFP